MAELLANCRKWVNLHIRESSEWRDSKYLPDVTYRLRLIWLAKALLCDVLLAYFFYESWVAALVLLPIVPALMYLQWRDWRRRVLTDITTGFKEWLYYVRGGLASGKSVSVAMLACGSQMEDLLGPAHPFLPGLRQLCRGINLHIPIEECIYRLGAGTGVLSIEEFAVVFAIVHRQGGSMSAALDGTIQQICEGIDSRLEVESMLAAKKLEQRIMCTMPFAILFFVGRASGGYFQVLYHNAQGILIMSGCMVVYVASVWWGRRITEVRI